MTENENTNWIKEAFQKAVSDAERANPITAMCSFHLEDETPCLLEIWGDMIGRKTSLKLAALMRDEELQNALYELSKTFFVGGYLSALDDVKNNRIEID